MKLEWDKDKAAGMIRINLIGDNGMEARSLAFRGWFEENINGNYMFSSSPHFYFFELEEDAAKFESLWR